MKKVLELIVAIVLGILMTPIWMIGGVVYFWKYFFDHPSAIKSVRKLLMYSARGYSGFVGDVVVCTNKNNTLYEGRWGMLINDWPRALCRMKVHSFWIDDGKLWIKVLINEDLIAKFEKELAERKEEVENETQENH